MLQLLISWLAQRPLTVVMSTLGVSLIALLLCFDLTTFQPRLEIDPATERLLPAGDADRAILDRARQTFGDSDAVLVAVNLDPVFTPQGLRTVAELTGRFRQLPQTQNVISLATAPFLLAEGETVDVASFTQQAEYRPELIPTFPDAIADNPLYRNSLVSEDGRIASFILVLAPIESKEFNSLNYARTIREMAQELAPGREVWITGTPVVRAETTRILNRALLFTVPAVFVIVGLLLFISFRCIRATLGAIATVALALLWTMAASVVLKIPFNLVTAIVPPLVITIGMSYTIHLLSAYFFSNRLRREEEYADASARGEQLKAVMRDTVRWFSSVLTGDDPRQLKGAAHTQWVMNRILTGLSLSAATTVAGFLALTLNPLPAITQFAVLASIGTIFTGGLTLVFLPSLLSITGTSKQKSGSGEKFFTRAADWLADITVRYRALIIAIAIVLIPLDLWFATKIRTGTDFIATFDADSTVRKDFEAINTTFKGANILSVFIETHVNDALTDPDIIREVEQLQAWIRKQPEVGGVTSYVDHLKLINQSLNENDPAFNTIPRDATTVKQLLIFGGSDDLKRVIDSRFRTTQMTVRITVDGSIAIGDFISRLEGQLRQLPPPFDAKVTGSTAIATRTVNEIASGHLESIALATLAIWIMLSIMFTSWRAGLLATLPNIVPVAVYFGALGLLGISLNPTTSLIACIVLGIAVNDTVHFLARFNADARSTADEKKALRSALRSVLRPITLATAALCLGFLVFTGSGMKNQIEFGALAAFTLAVAWIADITLTPALGSKLRIVTLWDVLRLDLGQSPQHTIPLFSGLSARQARIFALLSKMERVEKGQRIITTGDVAKDMYLIVDGVVEVSVERDGQRVLLSTMSRGGVLGETGYFGQRRTANVDAISTVRLLRFNADDLEGMRLRHPRIAATIFRNLNRVQAERIANMTRRL